MEYTASSTEDRKLHEKYHKQSTEGYDVGKDFVQKARDDSTVFEGVSGSGDRVCVIDCLDKPARKRRAQEVLEIAQRELGAVEIPEQDIWQERVKEGMEPRYKAYLYIRGTKCVGLLLVEKISEAHHVVESLKTTTKRSSSADTDGKGTALSALKARKQALAQAAAQPLQLSTAVVRGMQLGISRIWMSPTHRRQNFASRLLDTAIADYGCEKEVVAFSQPTEAGARLARRWFGKTYGWCVCM